MRIRRIVCKTLLMAILCVTLTAGARPVIYAKELAAQVGLSAFSPLTPTDLASLDGAGGDYLGSLPEGVLDQLENLQVLLIDKSKKTEVNTVGVWDSAFQDAQGIMALVQIAGNDNTVDMHLHLNVFLGGTFLGDFTGNWIDLSDLLSGV